MWFDRASIRHLTKLQAVIRNAERIIGAPLPSLQSIYLLQLESKRNKIMNDSFHPAHQYFDMLPSGRRLRAFKGTKRVLQYLPTNCQIIQWDQDTKKHVVNIIIWVFSLAD